MTGWVPGVEKVPRARELSLEFVRAFCDGDLDRLGGLLAEEFVFTGPLLTTRTRSDYLASLGRDPPESGAAFELLESFEEADRARLVYRYETGTRSLVIAQLSRCHDGRIVEMELVFDARAVNGDGGGASEAPSCDLRPERSSGRARGEGGSDR